ncbi:PAS domain-containing sensor histidine kinase [Pseudomonas sp. GV071]|uniref:hybrid sensor histidine kinase/response regulator n=1 Tax=Pseudomonas sp. GV071 TaxID=2135754 RepID=UPI000D38BB92|nr:PAS domain-containing sensor histidine kinase [Pseudomonas sp. GV071]PTQ69419.1 PAS domain S-box-containing protein [Pseudomonas sp. GV071]
MPQVKRKPDPLMSDDRYRLLLDAVTDYAIYMLDTQGLVSSWNAGAKRFKGYEEEEILGQHFSRFYTEEDRANGMPQLALLTAETEGRFEGEGWRQRKNGERFWCHVVIDPIRTASGALIGYAKVTRDLTERKMAEESLKQSEQQFRILVDGVTDYALYMLNPEGMITNWNTGAQRIKGYTPKEIIGRHYSVFFSPEDVAKGEPQRGLNRALAEGRFESQGWRIRKDGTRFWASVVVDPIRNDLGALIGFAKITRDITDSMEAQRALEKARESLFQAQKMESLGRLTGGIAHDFNNLLMVILGSLEVVRRRVPDEARILNLLDNAIQGAQRGASLTQRMLAFARSQKLVVEALDAQVLVRGMSDMLQRALGPQTRIEVRFPLRLSPLLADSNQLEMALLNLAVNARDAMATGGQIVIAAREETLAADDGELKAGGYVCLSVTDSGAGMDAQTLERAREPFFTTKGVGKGTGLGLSMVHGFAQQSGGRLMLSSEVGQGTTAEMWLPVANVSAQAEVANAAPVIGLSATVQALTVLVVDDDPLVLLSTAAMLDDLGYTALQASSGPEALERLAGNPNIDVVVTDLAMPEMTGAELAQQIKQRWPTLPVLLASGYADKLDDTDLALPHIGKPFNQNELVQALIELT